MAKPVFKAQATASATSAASVAATFAGAVGDVLFVAVSINDGTAEVSALIDSAGLDGGGNPYNDWRLVRANTFNNARLELWACRVEAAVTTVTANLSPSASAAMAIASYTGVAAWSVSSSLEVEASQNSDPAAALKVEIAQQQPQASCIGVAAFGVIADDFTSTTKGTGRAQLNSSNANVALVEQATTDANGQLRCGKATTALATAPNISASNLQSIELLVSSGLVLSTPPGYSDLPDSVFDAEKPSLGIHVAKVNDNAAFGMVRLEVFVGLYADGETVNLPQSPIDGYVYGRDELIYVWGIFTTANKDNNWLSANDSLWYCLWDVAQDTGKVTSKEYYRRSVEDTGSQTADGVLQVFTIAQREKNSLVMAASPVWTDIDITGFFQDAAQKTTPMKQLNENAKVGIISTEAMYMGEFVDGDTVPAPVSPVDGYVYDRDTEVKFVYSWRWTTSGSTFQQPAAADGQLGPLLASVSSSGVVDLTVEMINDRGENLITKAGWGRVAVSALCQRRTVTAPAKEYLLKSAASVGWTVGSRASLLGSTHPLYTGELVGIEFETGVAGNSTWCFVNASDVQIGASFLVPNTINTSSPYRPLTNPTFQNFYEIPAGAAYVKMLAWGTTTVSVSIEIWRFSPAVGSYGVTDLANQFAELDQELFMPGHPLLASSLAQIQLNAAEAMLSPEFFGPVIYKNGDKVPLPVSETDGYKYSRSELSYFWEWSNTTPHMAGGTHQRTPLFYAHVDQDTGAVTVGVWRLPPGGPYVDPEADGGRITVTVMGLRGAQRSAPALVEPTPPSDSGSAITDTNGGDTVNGV